MSDTAHSVPGQSILERLYARGAVRPHIGASSAFYDRFGLPDPWTEFRGWTPAEADPDGMFFFLSAAPYYARLRTQRQRDWRARRRLLMRLSDPMPKLQERSLRRLTGAVTLGVSAADVKPRVSQMAWTGDAAMVALVAPPTETAEATDRPTERLRDRERRRSRRRGDDVEAVEVLREIVRVASGPSRKVLVRVIEEVAALPSEDQVVVARHVTRQLKGPGARLARAAVRDTEEQHEATPVRVAAGRGVPEARRRRGLRPVLASSPSMQTLAFEEPPSVEPAQPSRRRRETQAPRVPSAASFREVPAATVAREVRTQRVTGRAGPSVDTLTAAASARPRRRPTEWAATLARETRKAAPSDTRYGLDAVRRPVRRGTARVALRAVEALYEPRRGAVIAASPTRFLRREADLLAPTPTVVDEPSHTRRTLARVEATRPRRSRLVAASPTSYVQPVGAEEAPVTVAPAATPRRAPSAPPAARPTPATRKLVERAPTPARPGRPSRPRPEPVVEPAASTRPRRIGAPVRPETEAPEVDEVGEIAARPARRRRAPAALHALDRAEPLVRSERVLAAPAVVRGLDERAPASVLEQPTRPTVRAVERAAVATERGRKRVSLAARPTSYVDQVVRPVVEPVEASIEAPRRFGRPTVRAATRADRSARTDSRGRALLTSGPTDHLGVAEAAEAEGPISRSPVRRVRRMRGASVDTSTVIEPTPPETSEPTPARRTPTARVAERLDEVRSESRRVRAAPAPAAASLDDEPARERVLVRDARGKVRASRRVAAGASAYASARLVAQVTEPTTETAEKARARLRTPLERRAVSRRGAVRRPMAHTVAGSDVRWLMPEPPAVPPRVVGARRVTGAGAVSRDRLADVLRKVSAAVRAVERADDARVLLPVAQRGLADARIAMEPRRRRLPTAGETIVLRVTVDEEAPAPVARAERRGTAREIARPGAATRPLRRAFAPTLAALEGLPVRQVEQAATRAEGRPSPAPRRTAARTVRTADGRYRPSPSRLPLEQADRLVSRRPERGVPVVGAPTTGPRRVAARPTPMAEARFAGAAEPEPTLGEATPGKPRPLGRTLDYVGGARRPARRATPTGLTLATPEAEADDDAPAWADRAVRGTAVKRRQRPLEEAPAPTTGRGGDLFTALARANRPQDVVQVILERGSKLRSDVAGLPEPAVRLVERIARVQEDVQTTARMAQRAPEGDLLSPTRRSSSASSVRMSTLPRSSGGASPAAVRKVQTLADKLMKLIHLAEVERKVTEAQRQVRMAADTPEARAEGGQGASPSKPGDAPNIKQLESDVLAAVLRELDLMKIRRQEDFSDVWW